MREKDKRGSLECFKRSKKAQISVFVIVALIVVAVIVLYFVFRGELDFGRQVPAELEPIYAYYLSCINEEVLNGAIVLGQQGGYIDTPEFSSGTDYMPFSSHLNFLGIGVPYWYYVSGNNIVREQVPSKDRMEQELNGFLRERLVGCDFSQFEGKGFEIIKDDELEVSTSIEEDVISVNVKQGLSIRFGNISWSSDSHNKEVRSNLGRFYDIALKIYKKQEQEMFLEEYGIDILRLYAPVDGVENGCNSKRWSVEGIRGDLITALESNIPAIKVKGDYYELKRGENEYFVQDIGENVDVDVNFMYLRSWPMKMEIWPSENGILKADPIGTQQELGMLGFCYIPYHFVYDFGFPVLIQMYSGSEMFQFPVVVYIDKNHPRKALDTEGLPDVVPELCENKINQLSVYTYNTELKPVEAEITFKCFETICDIGKTRLVDQDAVLIGDFPQCVNGFIIASAEGYETNKFPVTSIDPGSVTIILEKTHKLVLEVNSGNQRAEYAVIMFNKDNETEFLVYPEQREIELSEGWYDIRVQTYSGSSIDGEVVDSAVSGGGTDTFYMSDSELKESKRLIINAASFGIPSTAEELIINQNKVEESMLGIEIV